MTHKFDIPWSWWPTNLISYEVDDYKFDIPWSNDYKFDILWSWWPTNLISYEIDDYKFDTRWSCWPTNLISYEVSTTNLIPDDVGDPQIWYPMKFDTFILGSKTSENNTKQKF
jgi:hypothetical protein